MSADDLNKPDLLAAIRTEHVKLDGVLAPIDMLAVARDDGWTAKDILAHIAAWEQRLLSWIERWRETGRPERPEPGFTFADEDVLNERDYQASKDTSVADVRIEADTSFERVIGAIETLSDADLATRPETQEGPSWSWIVGANTYEHYQEHREEIEAWLAGHPA